MTYRTQTGSGGDDMRRCVGLTYLGLLASLAGASVLAQAPVPDWPDWAYGYLTSLGPDSPMSPPCPGETIPDGS